ncbi:ABC transporter permease [uncultured Methylobacterium sp.]|jgi:putative spermidine/putrescine transport system permease protein|uniref:ABC transporter permease n=1 Tax=uncultured Methylobacterium sp. TaxID=157278 RepID=UPI00262D6B2C|nr:ABC transporter permease [uncultured Methylobacterium sp.]
MSAEAGPVTAALADPAPARRRGTPYRLASSTWTVPVLVFLGFFFVIPLGANLWRSVATGDALVHGPFAFYAKLLGDAYYAGILAETLKVGVIATLASLVVGYPVAYFMVRYAGRWNGLIVFLLIAPLLTSIIMRTFGWRVLLARKGPVTLLLHDWGLIARPTNLADDPIAVYVALVHVLVPFMVLSIVAVLQQVDVRLEESSRVLGAGPLATFFRITLPLSLDGVATGCILVFVVTNGSFLTMLLLGGGKVTTLSLLIYQQFNVAQDTGFAAAMGNLLLFMALICLALQARFLRREGVKA